MADACSGFEAQNYLKDRCRKCFRLKDKHAQDDSSSVGTKKERRKSWRDRNTSENGGPEDLASEDAEILSISSYLSATSKGLSSIKSAESVNDTKSMVTAVSGSIEDDQRAITPTEDDNSAAISLKEEMSRLRENNRQLKEERDQWRRKQSSYTPKDDTEQSLVQMLEERLNEAENAIQDYRDENTVLKCELRELQETTYANSDQKLTEKIKQTEALCDELMEENEQLKSEVKDLQHEIEEMQDQYREDEIDEFRELQRELEQHAKNCRVLQFKLRKADRLKEQADTEKFQMQQKLNDVLASGAGGAVGGGLSDGVRVKELESELRIAKEVSVRLHTELEQAEEKRYKLEDEVFYLKEKIREMQTQNKWREARNKTDNAVKRLSAELSASVPVLPEGEVGKELKDALEREIDIREQLRFAEEDLKRTQIRLQDLENENEMLLKKLSKAQKLRPPMVRSASEGNAHLQLELAEHEVEHLNNKVERLEKTNDHLNKKIVELETDSTKRAGGTQALSNGTEFKMTAEMERDVSKMLLTISDLERKNLELSHQIKNHEKSSAKPNNNNCSAPSTPELRAEQEKRKVVESELMELRTTLLKTDNQKLIALATKIEQLNNQLQMANDRCTTLHKKFVKEGEQAKYMNEMKTRLETLEKQLSERKASNTIAELQGKIPTTDEMEQVCEVLASIESQTTRLCKQIEKIEHAQKDERRRSLSKDSGATIIAELANLMKELKNVHKLMDGIKSTNPGLMRKSPMKETIATKSECPKCKENDKALEEQQNEIVFYKKKNKDLTNQVLQTEDRWTIEIEKQRQIFENEIKSLGVRLTDAKLQIEEQTQLLESRSSSLIEKTKSLEEAEEKAKKLQKEVEDVRKQLQELDSDKKSVKEFEIKYNKLESIFEAEREKMNSERGRSKTEIVALKKIADDAEELLKSTSADLKKKDNLWKAEKSSLEREISHLKKQLQATRNGEGSEHEERASSHDSEKPESTQLSRQDSDKVHVIDLKKQIAQLEKQNADLGAKLEEVKIGNAELRDELNKNKSGWQKDKEQFQHKQRQTEKIRSVEMDAVQQKFSSRMRIMEDTNKSLHSQLVLARRERDAHKDSIANSEKKIETERNTVEQRLKEHQQSLSKAKNLQSRVAFLETELERVSTDLRLTKEARKADQILWKMDRARGRNEKITEEDKKSAENVQAQYQEYEKFYAKEVDRLNDRITQMTSEGVQRKAEHNKTVRELRETIRVLEIEQKNLSQNKDSTNAARELLTSETERLQQMVHLNELQKLTRKYRLSSIIDQLQYVTDPRRNGRDAETPDGVRYIIGQLMAIRDEDAIGPPSGDDRCQSTSLDRNGYAASDLDGTYDNVSQSSFSVRSVNSINVKSKWNNQQAQLTVTVPKNTSTNGSVTTQGGPISGSKTTTTDPVAATTSSPAHTLPPTNSPVPSQSSLTRDEDILSFATTKRSFSTESASGFDRYGRQRKTKLPDPPPSFMINLFDPDKEKCVEYDKEGRLHYRPRKPEEYASIVRSLQRTVSCDPQSEDDDEEASHSRTGSTGTNILCRIRREELARGGQPSVRMMAQAFESIDTNKVEKRGFFGIRKSRSVETTQDRNKKRGIGSSPSANPLRPPLGAVDEGVTTAYATLPRGGRNPFKNMGSRLVERVRRSLSRARSTSRDDPDRDHLPPMPEKKDKPTSPKKTKKKAAESKARKLSASSNGTH